MLLKRCYVAVTTEIILTTLNRMTLLGLYVALGDKTPYEKYPEVENKAPLQDEVTQSYWNSPQEKLYLEIANI
ncbi:MAG: hypothetical protein WCP46_02365 [Alphaproteobacteria bacterium]